VRLTKRAQPCAKTTLRVSTEPIGQELECLGGFPVVSSAREGLEVAEQPLRASRLVPEATAPPPLVGIEPPHALSYEADGEFFPERAAASTNLGRAFPPQPEPDVSLPSPSRPRA